ncbi:flagellar FlbD family protein [Sanguibacter gelidistatuariae]|uniref:flagellar FlbD family protein n=1 Tax=Sanguibacter gelidistatuariae TaxID=1814289 RepID=UPI000B855DF6|nr:flagellar FlbD family protein [Sanguibacter gelidistatuariae]
MTRLNGPPFAVNPDLVQRIDSAPDTILTLVDGTKYIVQESMHEIIELVNEHRSRMIARAQEIQRESAELPSRADLRSAPPLPADPSDVSEPTTPASDGSSRRDGQPELALVREILEEDA